jgi:hypothetical protein
LIRKSGDIEIVRRVPDVATLIQPTQPTREISLPRRSLRDCLSEDLRRLDPDDLFGKVITKGFAAVPKPKLTAAKKPAVKKSTEKKSAAKNPAAKKPVAKKK